jgi:pentatricopeptide repeat protein
VTLNIMISALFKARRLEEAKDLFSTLSANGTVPSVVTFDIMMTNFIKEDLLAEADDLFTLMERIGCVPDSHILNNVARVLLEKGEIVRAGNYLCKIDKKNFSLEASTVELLFSFSKETCQDYKELIPAKYHFLLGTNYR